MVSPKVNIHVIDKFNPSYILVNKLDNIYKKIWKDDDWEKKNHAGKEIWASSHETVISTSSPTSNWNKC